MSGKKLDKKVAVITGGNSGIGLATAKLFAAEGAQVVFTGRRKEAVEEAEREIGHGAVGLLADASVVRDHVRVAEEVKARFGRIDIYVANAAVLEMSPFEAVTEESFDRQYNTDVKGVYFGVQKALPLIPDGGVIILIGSIVSQIAMDGNSVYASTKAALTSFARSWTKELRARKIRVNILSPGPTDTPGLGTKSGIDRAAFEPVVAQAIPLGRMGTAEEMATGVLFLAGPEGSFINGVDLFVDGGMITV